MLASNYSGFSLEAGTDEAGRGCLSGPVVAAAVILPKEFTHPFLNATSVKYFSKFPIVIAPKPACSTTQFPSHKRS